MTANPLTRFETAGDPAEDRDGQRAERKTTLPASLDLMSAARLLGIGRTCAYGLISRGRWPTPVIRVGRCIRIPTQPLLALLELDPAVIHNPLATVGEEGKSVGH